jgi:putative DNA primase/helicase
MTSRYDDIQLDNEPPDDGQLLAPPSQPMVVARQFVAARYTCADGDLSLRHWRGGWWRWRTSHWTEVEDRAVREDTYRFTEHAVCEKDTKDGPTLAPWDPNRHKVADVLDALAAVCFLPETVQQPAWIADAGAPPGVIVACNNGLLHVDSRLLLPHSPRFFNQTAVPFAYDADALEPSRWLKFLDELWPDDAEIIHALQEFFGYVISGRTNLQKILMLVGPTRGGKGVIARMLGELIGPRECGRPDVAEPRDRLRVGATTRQTVSGHLRRSLERQQHVDLGRAPARHLGRGHDHRQPQVPRAVERQAPVAIRAHLQRATSLR